MRNSTLLVDINKKLLFLYYFIDNDAVKLKHILVRCAIDTFDALCMICLRRYGFSFFINVKECAYEEKLI